MAIKYREAVDLRMSTKQELTSSSENWLKFLRTASNTYKYNFSDQLYLHSSLMQKLLRYSMYGRKHLEEKFVKVKKA